MTTKMKVIVTGASGFIGSHLCRRLTQSGHEVHAVSRTRSGSEPGIRWWKADLSDAASVSSLLATIRPDVIFHLSGMVTGVSNKELVLPTFDSLLASTVNLLTAAADIGCHRIVLIGSVTEPLPESGTEATPRSPYAAAKWASGVYARMFHELYRTPTVNIRLFMGYGPRQDSSKLIPTLCTQILRGEQPVISNGHWRADWIFIDDVVDGLIAVIDAPKIEGSTIDLGSGILTSTYGLYQRLAGLLGSMVRPRQQSLPDRPMEKVRAADVAATFAKLKWHPTTSLDAGLKRTVEWYRSGSDKVNAMIVLGAPWLSLGLVEAGLLRLT